MVFFIVIYTCNCILVQSGLLGYYQLWHPGLSFQLGLEELVEKYSCCSLTTKRYNVSRLPDEFALTCPYSQFALSATNAVRVAPIVTSKSRLFPRLHRGIVTAISRWSKTFVCLRAHGNTFAS